MKALRTWQLGTDEHGETDLRFGFEPCTDAWVASAGR